MLYTLKDNDNGTKMTVEKMNKRYCRIAIYEDIDNLQINFEEFAINKIQMQSLIDALISLNKKMK